MKSEHMTRYEELRAEGQKGFTTGDVKAACQAYEQALEVAQHCVDEDDEILNKAQVNLALARVQAHQDELAEKGLREVLLRSSHADVIRVAAQCLAKILSHRNEHEKAHHQQHRCYYLVR